MDQILIYNRPSPRSFFWHSLSISFGSLFFYMVISPVKKEVENSTHIGFEPYPDLILNGYIEFFFLWVSWIFLTIGFRRLIRIERILVDQEFIYFVANQFLSSGKRLYTGGRLRIPLSSDFRFRAMKDGFLKGIGFYLDIPAVDGGRQSFLIVDHCVNPRRLAGRINKALEENGTFPRNVHMSKPLERSLYKKNVKNQRKQTKKTNR